MSTDLSCFGLDRLCRDRVCSTNHRSNLDTTLLGSVKCAEQVRCVHGRVACHKALHAASALRAQPALAMPLSTQSIGERFMHCCSTSLPNRSAQLHTRASLHRGKHRRALCCLSQRPHGRRFAQACFSRGLMHRSKPIEPHASQCMCLELWQRCSCPLATLCATPARLWPRMQRHRQLWLAAAPAANVMSQPCSKARRLQGVTRRRMVRSARV